MASIDHMQRNRFELKYLIDERCARAIRDFIRCHLIRDTYARADLAYSYPIYSIYLDSPSYHLCNATLHGIADRFKLRARYYDDNPATPVFLEIKRRANDVILKERAPIRRSALQRLLAGHLPDRDDLFDPADPSAYSALQRFSQLQRAIHATGRLAVAYMREAWNAREDDDVRVTFDRTVAASPFDNSLPASQSLRTDRNWSHPLIDGPPDPVILELKFNGRFPRWMHDLVSSFDLYRTSMAKYVQCVLLLASGGMGKYADLRPLAPGQSSILHLPSSNSALQEYLA